MPRFRYMAVDAQGKLQRGHMEAADTASVIAALRRQGCLPMEAELAEQTSLWHRLLHAEFGRRQALLHQETADLTRELAVMLGAGQDLDGALRFLVETAPNERVRAVTTGLRDAVRDGSSLADALARHPQSFPPVHVGMVRAGEAEIGRAHV